MRYIIQFVDKSTKRVSEQEGKAIAEALAKGSAIVIRGAYFNPRFISAVKPINTDWFSGEYVKLEERKAVDSFTAAPMLESGE